MHRSVLSKYVLNFEAKSCVDAIVCKVDYLEAWMYLDHVYEGDSPALRDDVVTKVNLFDMGMLLQKIRQRATCSITEVVAPVRREASEERLKRFLKDYKC